MLGDPDTPGFVLLTIILWAFGDAVFGNDHEEGMDSAELWASVYDRFGVWVTEEGENKLNALMLAVDGDAFYRDPEAFRAVCEALPDGDLGDIIDGALGDLTLADMMWSLLEVRMTLEAIMGETDDPEFSPAVRSVIEQVRQEEAFEENAATEAIDDAFDDMLRRLEEIGCAPGALRLLDSRYDPSENPGEILSDAVS